MNKKELIKHIREEIQNGRNVDLEYTINQIPYKIKFQKPNYDNDINIPSIIAIPIKENIGKKMIFESNNLESENFEHILEQGIQTAIRLARLTDNQPAPIVIPLIPSYKNAPYFQQLSRECLELPTQDRNYRIDEQVVRIIDKAKKIVKEERGIDLDNKIFLNGYSSSGVFAQRFALLHPELIDTTCIGGASGSIPILTEKLGYPIGLADYKKLTGKEFNTDVRFGRHARLPKVHVLVNDARNQIFAPTVYDRGGGCLECFPGRYNLGNHSLGNEHTALEGLAFIDNGNVLYEILHRLLLNYATAKIDKISFLFFGLAQNRDCFKKYRTFAFS